MSLLPCQQFIAQTFHSNQRLRLGRVHLNFLPDTPHMGVQTVFVAERIIAPQRFAERINRNDLTFISGQSFQKRMLLGGQSNRFSILADLCSAEIDRTAVKDNDRIVLRIRAAQYSRNAQQQLLRQKWFGNVIIRTKTQSGQFIGRFIFRCQEDHRHIGKSADLPKQRKTIPALSKIPSPSPTAEKPSSKPACTKPSCGRAHIMASSRQ